ncbi:MAG: elongation factor P [Planctomycetes bacterium]|nr:elongation factor P [Planctomycetota bacterium]
MSLLDPLKKGMVIRYEQKLYRVIDFHVAQTGQQKPRAHVKLRSLTGGHTTERLLDQMGRIEEVETELREMQYLYAAGQEHVFMDGETFEQVPLSEETIHDARDFLVEGETYRLLTVEGDPLEIVLPAQIALEVTDTAPVEHAGGASNVHKDARLASGLSIQVPLFINTGEKVRVNTETREYLGKEH